MHSTAILSKAKYFFDACHEPIFEQIDSNCSHYLTSQTSLFKQLPSEMADVGRIKLRHRRGDEFSQTFNECFEIAKLYERSLTCYTTTSRDLLPGHSWYAVYPPNGFKYYYNPACTDISKLRDIDPKLLPQVIDLSFFSEQLQSHTYLDPEVIVFNIPSYYVVRIDV